MAKQKLKSEIISDFLNLFDNAQKEFSIAYDYIGKANQATNDLLHSIEFEADRNERTKIATQLRTIRKDRRYYKDIYEEAEPINEFYKEYKNDINQLKQVLGQVRKAEKYHEDRKYCPRFFKDDDQ